MCCYCLCQWSKRLFCFFHSTLSDFRLHVCSSDRLYRPPKSRPKISGVEKEVTEVWVFLHTPAEAVIIVGEEETDELITRREVG